MQKYSSYIATNNGDFTLSQRDVQLNFGLDTGGEVFNDIRHILKNGECEGAVVISVFPLYIAAYAKEMDAVVLLDFSAKELEGLNRGLFVKSRLLTVNGYEADNKFKKRGSIQKDLIPSKNTTYEWQKVYPIIADFVIEEKNRLEQIKKDFTDEYWNYIYELGSAYFRFNKGFSRIGLPDRSGKALLGIDVKAYYKKTYGNSYRDYMPVQLGKKKNKALLAAIYVTAMIIYFLLHQFTDNNEANIFKFFFKIFF